MNPTTTTTAGMLYECGECGELGTGRRCEDCNRFTTKLGPGGHCPACEEPILISDILDKSPRSTTATYTEDLTSSRLPAAPGPRADGEPAGDRGGEPGADRGGEPGADPHAGCGDTCTAFRDLAAAADEDEDEDDSDDAADDRFLVNDADRPAGDDRAAGAGDSGSVVREMAWDRDWTRHLIDRGAEVYRPSKHLRAFVAARECAGSRGARARPGSATATTS